MIDILVEVQFDNMFPLNFKALQDYFLFFEAANKSLLNNSVFYKSILAKYLSIY